MIKLSGLEPDIDIQIDIIGLREGEKLYEELLNDKENTLPTYHKKILIADVRKVSYESISMRIATLLSITNQKDEHKIVEIMKQMVPEFVSNASRFEVLDKKMVG